MHQINLINHVLIDGNKVKILGIEFASKSSGTSIVLGGCRANTQKLI